MSRFPVTVLALVLLGAPLAVEAQQTGRVYRIGELTGGGTSVASVRTSFRERLRELGYLEGRNVVFETRAAERRPDRLPALAIELVRLNVDVIVTAGADGVRAARQATRTIPIVAAVIREPVAFGFVDSLARPGGNITGLTFQDEELVTKRLELLKETLPGLARVAALHDPTEGGPAARRKVDEAARLLGLSLQVLDVKALDDLPRALVAAKRERAQALLLLASAFFSFNQTRMVNLAIESRLPASCPQQRFVQAGCLMSYGPDLDDMFRRAATLVDKILKGARPADLPMEQPTRFELVVNLRTAKALRLTIPQSVLARADAVIQ